MKNKKISRMTIVRFLDLYGGTKGIVTDLVLEMARMQPGSKDSSRCAMVTSMSNLRKFWVNNKTRIGLICDPKHVRRILSTDVSSYWDKDINQRIITRCACKAYSECWIKAGVPCYTGVCITDWSNAKLALRKIICDAVLGLTPWSSILDLKSGKTIDLTKWKSGAL